MERKRKYVGTPLKRQEDFRFLTGKGAYADDIHLPGMLHCAILRSPHAHARIKSIDTSEAARLQGVAAVLTGADVAKMTRPFPLAITKVEINMYCMAVDKVRYVGEPVAAVAALDRYVAEDAIDLIKVEYEMLPAVVDIEEAIKPDAPVLHDTLGSNIPWHRLYRYGDIEQAFEEADLVVKEKLKFPRFASTPIETYGVIAHYERARQQLTLWSGEQNPGMLQAAVSMPLQIPNNRLRIIVPDIGGGFGNKISVFNTSLIPCLLSMQTDRPVKYIEDRLEHNSAQCHGSDRMWEVEMPVKKDGTVLGIKIKHYDNFGGYLRAPEPMGIGLAFHVSWVGCYRWRNVEVDCYAVLTNKALTGANRGYGRQPAHFVLERMMDKVARELGIDRLELRRKNFIRSDEFPYETPSGSLYDSGNYEAVLDGAVKLLGYDDFKKQQEELRKQGRYIGIGFSCEVESSASNMAEFSFLDPDAWMFGTGQAEACRIHMDLTGKVTVLFGSPCMGMSHETVIAQIVADELGIRPEDVMVLSGYDSATHPHTSHSGSYSSRFGSIGSSVVVGAARKLKEKIVKIAAHSLDANPEDIELLDGVARIKGSPDRAIPLQRIGAIANSDTLALRKDMEPGLDVTYYQQFATVTLVDEAGKANLACTYANGTHAAVVEVDVETGVVKVLKYVVASDCGFPINPMVVEGQIHGGVLHGVGGALWEEFVYDENGQLLNSSFIDYLVPRATEFVNLEARHVNTPSPFTALGSKGMGEAGATSAPACIASAVEDALTPFGVRVTQLPLTPERLLSLMVS